ncbi:MAG: DUF1508 domain-containing protein [Christensenellales bacterium]|jgi:uncharacterized protein YegP (UPF0339 family)
MEMILSSALSDFLSIDYVRIILFTALALIIVVCLYLGRLLSLKRIKEAGKEKPAESKAEEEVVQASAEESEPSAETAETEAVETDAEVSESEAEEHLETVAPEAVQAYEETLPPQDFEAPESAAGEALVEEEVVEPASEPEEGEEAPAVELAQVAEAAPAEIAEKQEEAAREEAARDEAVEPKAVEIPLAPTDDTAAALATAEVTERYGKYVVSRLDNDREKFKFSLFASNGQVLYISKGYASKESCIAGIDSFKRAVEEGEFSVDNDKSGRVSFRLTRGSRIYSGETVKTESTVLNTIESVKRFASSETVKDISDEEPECEAEVTAYAYKPETPYGEENAEGGRYVIEKNASSDKPKFKFYLKSANNQVIYESREFASKASCKNGIETFKNAVYMGRFAVEADKSGRFNYVIETKTARYQGETVKARSTAENAIEAVRRYAATSVIAEADKPAE